MSATSDENENERRDPVFDALPFATSLPTQTLLLALYNKTFEQIQLDVEANPGDPRVFGEKPRLAVLLERLGEIVMRITDTQFDMGDRSDGWEDLTRSKMRDLVMTSIRRCQNNAQRYRDTTASLERGSDPR